MNGLREYWSARETRERVLLGILGALVASIALFYLVIRPVMAAGDAPNPLEAAQADREIFLRAAPRLNSGVTDGARQPFTRSVLIEAARARDIRVSRVQPDGRGGLTVWVEDVPTQALYDLFADVLGGYAVTLRQSTVSLSDTGGLDAQFTLATP